jgi:hypothetical protein
LTQCINKIITYQDLEDWASTIECRDDLDFENKELQEVIFELASPEINGPMTKLRLQNVVHNLHHEINE